MDESIHIFKVPTEKFLHVIVFNKRPCGMLRLIWMWKLSFMNLYSTASMIKDGSSPDRPLPLSSGGMHCQDSFSFFSGWGGGATLGDVQWLLMAVHSGITTHSAWGTIWNGRIEPELATYKANALFMYYSAS